VINEIILSQFKKHHLLKLNTNSKICLFFGHNACGKTSILEALNLLTPGTGIFSTNTEDLIEFNKTSFEVHINSSTKTIINYAFSKKEININKHITKPLQLLEYFRVYGLTPYIAFAFWKDAALRRKHMDRLVMQNEILFASYYAKYTKALREYNKLVELKQLNNAWEQTLAPIIIENGIKIIKTRSKVFNQICTTLSDYIIDFLDGPLEIKTHLTDDEQIKILNNLKPNFDGPHRTKFEFITQNYNGKYASTGQQKKILLTLIIKALPQNSDTENILLLDDLLSQLDARTINQLLNILEKQEFQTFITNIDKIERNNIKNIGV